MEAAALEQPLTLYRVCYLLFAFHALITSSVLLFASTYCSDRRRAARKAFQRVREGLRLIGSIC